MTDSPDQTESALVSADWLASRLLLPHSQGKNLVVLDASVPSVVPGFQSINTTDSFTAIPGARRFDYDQKVCKPDSTLPHMMPGSGLFQEQAQALGINRDSLVVVYDDVGIYASPRAWWMFRAMGHHQVLVLDGGLPAWIAAGHAVSDTHGEAEEQGNFVAREDESLFCDVEVVLAAIDESDCQILDARSEGRFKGLEPEPRPGLRAGHIPSARNLFFGSVLQQGRLKPAEQLAELLQGVVAANQKIITSCGSGITACVIALAAWEAGYRNLSVYDGSWAEWGLPSKLPVMKD